MNDKIERISNGLLKLSEAQLKSINSIVEQFQRPYISITPNPVSDLLPKNFLHDFGDMIRLHHCFSEGPFSKDKFEFALNQAFNLNSLKAKLAPTGTPSIDIYVKGQTYSLKTQADKDTKLHEIKISKFREIGSFFTAGKWTDKIDDIMYLTEMFIVKLDLCDRILILRNISPKSKKKPKNLGNSLTIPSSDSRPDRIYKYELVEIPIDILKKAKTGSFNLSAGNSYPRSGFCKVHDGSELVFQLYFDGAGEQKLQIQKLQKKFCIVHATWEFDVKPVLPDSENVQDEE